MPKRLHRPDIRIAILFAILVAASAPGRAADAATVVATVALPVSDNNFNAINVAADCNGHLYYTSGYNLYKTNKSGTLLAAVPTTDSSGAPIALDELAWDRLRGLLWAGGGLSVVLLNPVTGVATFQFAGPAQGGPAGCCLIDGLAYDQADDTIWLSYDQSRDVYNYDTTGTLRRTITPRNALGIPIGLIAGIEVSLAGTLFVVHTFPTMTVHAVDKSTGLFVSVPGFPDSSLTLAEGLEIDAVSFAPTEVLWARQGSVLTALEIPSGSRRCDPDHFKCYSVQGEKLNATVSLADQFEDRVGVKVTKPTLLCNPVDKNGEGIQTPLAHLVCYEIKESGFQQRDVSVTNQFGEARLKVKAPELLCVPSLKTENRPCGPTGIRMCGGGCPHAADICVVSPVDAGCVCQRPAIK